ncbi:uroporphyrinogen-III synthase [Shewanella gaetbuli]|uniref:Uroporphyrinogen-III synthase n=1 Tax=Shewanella gaetbuli TaxID=220752 RepID=A0A9X1ZGC5_9GAMM|nr:uroporphyrinogen-III synthase [Shewanella gaetbuli]MCL1141086.1 uroporphyrinogen-III synthase [Shewanella gaetbuli]
MKVLLTRPEGRNQDMIEQLEQYQVAHLVTPLLAVVASQSAQPIGFAEADKLIFVSTNAVKFAALALNHPFPKQSQYFAVGQATAQALISQGLTPYCAPENSQDSEGLLALPELKDVNNQNIIICRGSGGRETIAQELTLKGANVSYWNVYKRQLPSLDYSKLYQQWIHFGIDTIVLTSGEVLTNLISIIPKESFAWLNSCHIIVPSNRVELQANALGLTKVTNANGANTHAVIAALGLSA